MDKVQRDILASLDAATEASSTLTDEVGELRRELNRSRQHIRVLATAVVLVLASVLLTLTAVNSARKATSRATIACQANAATSQTMEDILRIFQAGTPTKPPAGSTPAQVKAFNEGLARSKATYGAVFARLAASGC